MQRGIKPEVRNAFGELSVTVNGERIYSYKEAGHLIQHAELLSRIQQKLG